MSLINRAGSAIRERDEKYRLLLNVVEQKDDAISRLVKQLEALQSSQAQHVQIESDLSHGGAISGDGHQCFHGEMGSRTNEELRAARLQLEEERERRKQVSDSQMICPYLCP